MKKLLLGLIAIAEAFTLSAQQQKQVISIETEQKGYYLFVEESGVVRQCYFGDRMTNPDDLIEGYTPGHNVEYYNMKSDAYSTFGGGDTGEVSLKLTHSDGNMTTRLRYENHTRESLDGGNVVVTKVILKDEHYPLTVTLIYKAYQSENVFAISNVIEHKERRDIKIQGAMSSYLAIKAEDYWLTRFYGSHAVEMQMVESKLEDGITILDSKRGVRTTMDGSPSFILSLDNPANETSGEVIFGSLAWSGNYKLTFELDNLNKLNILSGMNDFLSDYSISSKEKFKTPEFILTHSNNGMGEASRNLHDWVRRYNLQDSETLRPVVLNSWEGAYFSFDEDVIKKMIEDAASMGVEMFVLDDGWFGSKYPRNSAAAGLGDWEINENKLPNGIQELIDHSHRNGIQFGIWVEPEMVNPKSALAERHPDWIVTSPNREPLLIRNQRLLDLTNPKVVEFVHGVVADLLREYPDIAYIKWDANRHVQDFGSSYLASDKQSHFWIDYTRNLYSIYERLSSEFPNVIFQACSSGGGRIDYGSMKYHHEAWGSDNTDGERRLTINWGLNHFFPAQSIASHVSQSPNHQTKHISPIKFRFDVAMSQRMGIELQPTKLTPAELDWTKRGVELYKEKIRPVVQHGDQYRLISPYGDSGFASMIYVDKAKESAIFFLYTLEFHMRESYPVVKLQGLDPEKRYMVSELLPLENGRGVPQYKSNAEGKSFSGDYLMKYGIRVTLRSRYESAVFEIKEV